MIQHYSHNIQNQIQSLLFQAKESIKIAVAWFTNDLLFQPLLLKLQTGVAVELILNHDDINCSESNIIDFDDFVRKGGILRWNESNRLLHIKFCVIDSSIVITGSYNWTKKAESNEEQITVYQNEIDTTTYYLEQFDALSTRFQPVKLIEQKRTIIDCEPLQKYSTDSNEYDEGYEYDERIAYYRKTGYSQDGTALLYFKSERNGITFNLKPGTKVICNNAFRDSSVMEVLLPESLEHIGDFAFFNANFLKEISIPKYVCEIGFCAFSSCDSLWKISVNTLNQSYDSRDESNAIIESKSNKIIFGCRGTKIPNSVYIIGKYAFYGCIIYGKITIPANVQRIEYGAFEKCANLESITILNPNIIIEDKAFHDCKSLKTIFIPKGSKNRFLSILPSYLNDIITEILDVESDNSGSIYREDEVLLKLSKFSSHYSVREGTRIIATRASDNNMSLTSIEFPESLQMIEGLAFNNCKKLVNIKWSNSITSIGSRAFSRCAITELNLPDSVEYLGTGAFSDCNELKIITLSASLKEIPEFAFLGNSALEQITFNEKLSRIGNKSFCHCKNLKSICLPGSLKSIGIGPFYYSGLMESVRLIGDNQRRIFPTGETIFPNFAFPSTLTTIENEAFAKFKELIHVEFPGSISYIGKKAFYECRKLAELHIPISSKLHIDEEAFACCENLKHIVVPFDSEVVFTNKCFSKCGLIDWIALSEKSSISESCFEGTTVNLIIVPLGQTPKFKRLLPSLKDKIIEFKYYADLNQLMMLPKYSPQYTQEQANNWEVKPPMRNFKYR